MPDLTAGARRRLAREMRDDPIVQVKERVFDVVAWGWVVRFYVPHNYPFRAPMALLRRDGGGGRWIEFELECSPALTLTQYAVGLVAELTADRADNMDAKAEALLIDAINEMDPDLSRDIFSKIDRIEQNAARLREALRQ